MLRFVAAFFSFKFGYAFGKVVGSAIAMSIVFIFSVALFVIKAFLLETEAVLANLVIAVRSRV